MTAPRRDDPNAIEGSVRRNRIVLSDYDYEQDILHRILMSKLSVFEASALCEIVDGSLKTTVSELSSTLECPKEQLAEVLEKLAEAGLIEVKNDAITVDKELRRYYETQIEKFDEDFRPGVGYLLDLLRKVPIHILPAWYPISRTSDDIFGSIIEKYLETPKIYQRYLKELVLEDSVQQGIQEAVYSAPNYRVYSRDLREQFDLSRAQFEEAMLHLEFNMVCFLSYEQDGERWREVVTPLFELRQYLLEQKNRVSSIVPMPEAVESKSLTEFAFVKGMNEVMTSLTNSEEPAAGTDPSLEKLLQLGYVEETDSSFTPTSAGCEWMDLSIYDKAMAIYRHPRNWGISWDIAPHICTERNIRTAEKSLRKVAKDGWIDFNTFIDSLSISLGESGPVKLQKLARGRWKYVPPHYGADERRLIYLTIFERLHEVGMVDIGICNGSDCFRVTTFGQLALGE